MRSIERLYWGLLARILNIFCPIKKNLWVFGSDYGKSFREGSKYLMKYMYTDHPEYSCVFLTKSLDVLSEVRSLGYKCYLNNSWLGVYYAIKAERVFTCQYLNDIDYTFKKPGRHYYYVLHGMPYKLAMNSVPDRLKDSFRYKRSNLFTKIRGRLASYLIQGYEMKDVDFISVTSDYLVPFAKLDFTKEMDVRVLGMPRNDILFDKEAMGEMGWIKEAKDKFVITYMPTHRHYGAGELSPLPFESNAEAISWLKSHNIVILVKQHPNMIPKLNGEPNIEDVIIDITKKRLDPQLCIYHSDVLITDYSSVWLDYLLLRRPILFYYYDDFDNDDAGTHYSIHEVKPGEFCYNEDDLLVSIKECYNNYSLMCPKNDVIGLFHKYIDGNSCQRYFDEITK